MNTKSSTTNSSAPSLPKPKRGLARVLVIVGGAFQSLTRFATAAAADIILYLDVANELMAARPVRQVVCRALVPGETLGSLKERYATESECLALSELPGLGLFDGLGQLRLVGELAAKHLLADPEFVRFVRQHVFTPLMIKHNGQILQVEITCASSLAGGTGGPIVPPVGRAVADVFLQSLRAPVRLHFQRVGSLSFMGNGERVDRNAGVALAQDIAFVGSNDWHPFASCSMEVFEAIMAGTQRPARESFIAQVTQARNSDAVNKWTKIAFPNLALNSRLGTVTILDTACWNALSDRQIALEVASDFMPRLHSIAQTPADASRVLGVEVAANAEKLTSVESVEAIVQCIVDNGGHRPERLLERCALPPQSYPVGTVTVTLRDSTRHNLTTALSAVVQQPAFSEAELRDKISLLRSIESALGTAASSRQTESTARIGDLERLVKELERHVNEMYPTDLKGRFIHLFRNHQAHLTSFQNALVDCREVLQEKARLEAEIELLRSVKNQVHVGLENEIGRVQSVVNLLLRFSPAKSTSSAAWVEIGPMETVLSELLRLAVDYDEDQVLRVLGSCAQRITMAGLAAIAGAAEPTAASIAHRLVREEPTIVAPPWGADIRIVRGRKITVLPPVSAHVEEAIRQEAHFLDKDAVIVCADTTEAGANIVRLEFHEPRSADDILTQFYEHACREASQSPVLYSVNGSSAFSRNGHGQVHPRVNADAANPA